MGPTADYPLLLAPHLAPRVWGGGTMGEGIGEAWDLSVHPHGPCTIENGPLRGQTLAGVAAASPDELGGPIDLLAKRLDCAQDLSVQVHPRTGDPKTEAWIVLDGQPGAGVYHGFAEPVSRARVREAAEDGSLPKILRFVEVETGQCVFVPSGTVHAIGGGLFLFELQQSADTTYRLYDWGRGRELHLDQGLDCSDFDAIPAMPSPQALPDGALRLVECEHFFIDRLDVVKPGTLAPGPRWTALLVVSGGAKVGDVNAEAGQTVLLPHAAGETSLEPRNGCTVLRYGPG